MTLSDDGTWKYVEEIKNTDSIQVNPVQFTKPATANFLLKSKNSSAGFWLNSKKWNFEKSTGDASEYSFSLKENTSVGGIVVSEAVGMELQSLRKFALNNIQSAASKFKIIREEYRYVNGLKVLYIESDATVQGMQLVYSNYYYSDSATTIQYLVYTAKSLAVKYKSAGEELLNGLVVTGENDAAGADKQNKGTIQSALVANSDCKALFKGSWSYVANGKKYIDKIEQGKITETSVNNTHQSEYSMQWINNCSYELKLLRSNDPATKLIKKGAVITVDIMEIDAAKMRYLLTYGEANTRGVMTKED